MELICYDIAFHERIRYGECCSIAETNGYNQHLFKIMQNISEFVKG